MPWSHCLPVCSSPVLPLTLKTHKKTNNGQTQTENDRVSSSQDIFSDWFWLNINPKKKKKMMPLTDTLWVKHTRKHQLWNLVELRKTVGPQSRRLIVLLNCFWKINFKFTSQTELLHIHFQVKSTVCCRAVTISDIYYMIINDRTIQGDDIITVSIEIWKNMLIIKIIFIFVYCVLSLFAYYYWSESSEQKGQLHSVIVNM